MPEKKIKNKKSTVKPLVKAVAGANRMMIEPDGKHSFLFWLVLPFVLVWLSVGYAVGVIGDQPLWANSKKSENAVKTVQYFKDYGTFKENLDQPFVTFWFDDGWYSQYEVAYPILGGNGFVGTLAVAVNGVESEGYVNWAQLRTMQKNGWEMNSHSIFHDCEMEKWSRDQIAEEFKTSRFILWKNGLGSDIFVSPCGVDSKVMREEATKLFIGYRTVNPGFNDPKTVSFYDLKVKNIDNKTTVQDVRSWIDEAKANKYWVILVFHKIGEATGNVTEDEFNTSSNDFLQITKYVKESGIKVVTPSQILASQ